MGQVTELTTTAADSRRFLVDGLDALAAFARALAASLQGGEVLSLEGPLGVGKTELVRAAVLALGGANEVSSPTFVLEAVYPLAAHPPFEPGAAPGIREVHHWDLYRLRGAQVPEELGELSRDPDAVTFVEWARIVEGIDDLLCLELVLAFSDEEPRVSGPAAVRPDGVPAGATSPGTGSEAESARAGALGPHPAGDEEAAPAEQLSPGSFVDNGKRIITVRRLTRSRFDLDRFAALLAAG